MKVGWIYVFLAAFIEIFWVLGLKYSVNLWMWTGTIIIIILSFIFVIKACAKLPSGTVYAVFTGLGAASIVIVVYALFGVDFTFEIGLFIFLFQLGVFVVLLLMYVVVNIGTLLHTQFILTKFYFKRN